MDGGPQVRVPDPPIYKGACNAQEIDFFWAMELCFEATRTVTEQAKISLAAHYLGDDALSWWRSCCNGFEMGHFPVRTRAEFKDELECMFYPKNGHGVTMKRLKDLKQTGTITEYAKEFQCLMLKLPDMGESDQMLCLMAGLQPWAEQELRCRDVHTVVEALQELKFLSENSGENLKGKGQGDSVGHGGRNKSVEEGPRSQGTCNHGASSNQSKVQTSKRGCFFYVMETITFGIAESGRDSLDYDWGVKVTKGNSEDMFEAKD